MTRADFEIFMLHYGVFIVFLSLQSKGGKALWDVKAMEIKYNPIILAKEEMQLECVNIMS